MIPMIEPRVSHNEYLEHAVHETLNFAIGLWDGPIILAGGGGYQSDNVQRVLDGTYPNEVIMIMFGRPFVANPDLIFRIRISLYHSMVMAAARFRPSRTMRDVLTIRSVISS